MAGSENRPQSYSLKSFSNSFPRVAKISDTLTVPAIGILYDVSNNGNRVIFIVFSNIFATGQHFLVCLCVGLVDVFARAGIAGKCQTEKDHCLQGHP